MTTCKVLFLYPIHTTHFKLWSGFSFFMIEITLTYQGTVMLAIRTKPDHTDMVL